ncbi:hypothetical protein ID741_002873 [Enterococcus sp. AZ103]
MGLGTGVLIVVIVLLILVLMSLLLILISIYNLLKNRKKLLSLFILSAGIAMLAFLFYFFVLKNS